MRLKTPPNETEKSQWFIPDRINVDMVVLLVHGLNQKPSKLAEIVDLFYRKGIPVFRLTLKGHGGASFRDMMEVSPNDWLENFETACREIKDRYPTAVNVLVGYSLGGLVSQYYQLNEGKSFFDRQILIAPALVARKYVTLIRPFLRFTDRIPSRAPVDYRANKQGTSSAAYRSMFFMMKRVSKMKHFPSINIETLVLISPGDEVVSYRGIKRLISRGNLNQWKISPIVKREREVLDFDYHHLIIDRASLGEKGWLYFSGEIVRFLNL